MQHVFKAVVVVSVCVAAGCKSDATVTVAPSVPEEVKPVEPPVKKILPSGAALKTHGQLRETFETLTGVTMPNDKYAPLVPHLPHQQDLQGLTGASQAAIFRLASEHCAFVVSDPNAEKAEKVFGVKPSDKPFDANQIDPLVSKSMTLWPKSSDAAATEFKSTLQEVLSLASTDKKPVTERAIVLAACTATLASAHISMH